MNKIDLRDSRVLVTGARSMIGTATKFALTSRPSCVICSVDHSWCDLLDFKKTLEVFENSKPDYVIHLATYSGNIQFNQKYPADTYYRTTQIGLNVLEACRQVNVKKVVSILSSCAIADIGDRLLREEDLWNGLPNPSIECHGLAKRNLHAFSRQLYKQYGMTAVCCIVNNSYGPKDSFDPDKTKVIGAMIKKFVDAKREKLPEVVCWGTGAPLREFIYCYDAGEAIVQVLEKYNDSISPINIGNKYEVSIKELAELIAELVEYEGKIVWDVSKGDGQMRKKLDLTKMDQYINLNYTTIRQGLKETIAWYRRKR